MVFWESYPFSIFIQSIFKKSTFEDLTFDKNQIDSPTGNKAELLRHPDYLTTKLICEHLKNYFGNPPHTPILDIPESCLLQSNDFIFYVKDKEQNIAGCVRYHYIGTFLSKPMYLVDCFCIHPSWRKKGVGDYLLTVLHNYSNNKAIPHCLFLKEGSSLSILHLPFYSGIYSYKKVEYGFHNIMTLSNKQAHNIVCIFQKINPNLFIVWNSNSNQLWKLYKKNHYSILACIQDTYQCCIEEGQKKKIGWITCWLESPNVTNLIREEASIEISNSLVGIFNYIWTNQKWTGYSSQWKMDGAFHWYTYQWSTTISMNDNYCILH